MASKITVKTQGQILKVTITTPAGTAPTVYTTSALSASHTMPLTITSDTEFWLNYNWMPFDVQVAQADGTVLHSARHTVSPDAPILLSPEPSAAQVAADLSAGAGLRPSGAIAETYPRQNTPGANSNVLTSGQLNLTAIDLPLGATITTATFFSHTTAASTPTNQWFALYDSSLALLGQTADDTTTAWAANSAKTLTFATPIVTTKAGPHYLGINVTATTVPTLFGFDLGSSTGYNAITPRINGASTGSLTGTAPATAGAMTYNRNKPYAYVS